MTGGAIFHIQAAPHRHPTTFHKTNIRRKNSVATNAPKQLHTSKATESRPDTPLPHDLKTSKFSKHDLGLPHAPLRGITQPHSIRAKTKRHPFPQTNPSNPILRRGSSSALKPSTQIAPNTVALRLENHFTSTNLTSRRRKIPLLQSTLSSFQSYTPTRPTSPTSHSQHSLQSLQ